MAQLTDQLADISQGAIKPVREAPAGGKGIATAIGALGDFASIFDKERKSAAIEKRQAEQDKYTQGEHMADYQAQMAIESANKTVNTPVKMNFSDAAASVFADGITTGASLTGPVQDRVDAVTNKLTNVQTAISQGRMPNISYSAALNKEYLTLINAHPEHAGAITEAFKKRGLTPSLATQAIDDEQDNQLAVREQSQEWQGKMFSKGMESLDPEVASTMTREQVIAQGAAAAHAEYTLAQTKAQAELVLTQASTTEKNRTAAQEQVDDAIIQNGVVSAYNLGLPLQSAMQSLMGAIDKAPESQQQVLFEKMGPKFEQWSQNFKKNALAQAAAHGLSPDKMASYSAQLDNMLNGVKSMWSGDLSVAKSSQRALQSITATADIDANKAMPAFLAFKKLGLNMDEFPGLMDGLKSDPKLLEQFKKELSGYAQDIGQSRPSTHLTNAIRILKGEARIEDYDPAAARAAMPTLYGAAKTYAHQYANGVGNIDTGTMLNAVGSVISAARTVNPGSGLATLQAASLGAAGRDTRRALIRAVKDPVHNDTAEATITGSRAVSSQVVQSLKPLLEKARDTYHFIQITQDGRAKIFFNDAKWNADQKIPSQASGLGRSANFGFQRADLNNVKPQPTAQQKLMVDLWNGNIDNLTELNDYDKADGIKGATPLEIARFYGKGIKPASMKEGKNIDPNREIDKAMSIVDDAFNKIPEMNQPIAAAINTVEGTGDNPRSSASGPGQFTDGTFKQMMAKYHPEVDLSGDLKPLKKQYGAGLTNLYARENGQLLANAGLPVTAGNTYLMHFAGPGDGLKLLQSDPSTPVEQVMSSASIKANPHIQGMTVGQVIQWAHGTVQKGMKRNA